MKNVLLASLILGVMLPTGFARGDGSEDELLLAVPAEASESDDAIFITLRVPLTSPYFSAMPVAIVDEEPITFRDLTRRVSAIHAGMEEEETTAKKDYADLLDRVITSQLIVQEALNIGLDELPEVAKQVDDVSTELLISKVMSRELDKVEVDPEELRDLYGKMSREMLLATVKFPNEQQAESFKESFESGEAFGGLVKRFVDEGRAEASDPEFMQLKDLLPNVARVVYDMEQGTISQIFSASDGFFLFHLEGERFVEDPDVEEEARQKMLAPLKQAAAREYADRLEKKHASVNERLLRSVDFENERTGFLSLRKKKRTDLEDLVQDDRVVATVHVDPPFEITVGEIAGQVQEIFFHGIETAIEKRDLNDEKHVVLKNLLFKKTVVAEAHELGLDQEEEYLDAVDEYTKSVLFNTFVHKVIAPDVEIEEEEVREYYAEHLGDFSSPGMVRLKGLAFHSLADAKGALRKLRKGSDFKWVSANSPGLVAKGTEGVFEFGATPLTLGALPEGLHEQAEKAGPGDSLLYSDPNDFHYAIVVEKVYPATPQAYEKTRGPIARIVFEQKVKALIAEWGEKLKEVYETRIFVVGPMS